MYLSPDQFLGDHKPTSNPLDDPVVEFCEGCGSAWPCLYVEAVRGMLVFVEDALDTQRAAHEADNEMLRMFLAKTFPNSEPRPSEIVQSFAIRVISRLTPPDQRHQVTFYGDGTWDLGHPDRCAPDALSCALSVAMRHEEGFSISETTSFFADMHAGRIVLGDEIPQSVQQAMRDAPVEDQPVEDVPFEESIPVEDLPAELPTKRTRTPRVRLTKTDD